MNAGSGVETRPLGSYMGREPYQESGDFRFGALWDQIGRKTGVFAITGKPGSGKTLLWSELGIGMRSFIFLFYLFIIDLVLSGEQVTYLSMEMENEDMATLVATQLAEADKPKTLKELEPWRKLLKQLPVRIQAKPEAWHREKFRKFCEEEVARGTTWLFLDHSALFVG